MQRLGGAAFRDRAAAAAKQARRAAEVAESFEEDADVERKGCWASLLHTRLRLHLVLMKAVVARVKRGASRIGVSHGLKSGLPHQDQHRKA